MNLIKHQTNSFLCTTTPSLWLNRVRCCLVLVLVLVLSFSSSYANYSSSPGAPAVFYGHASLASKGKTAAKKLFDFSYAELTESDLEGDKSAHINKDVLFTTNGFFTESFNPSYLQLQPVGLIPVQPPFNGPLALTKLKPYLLYQQLKIDC